MGKQDSQRGNVNCLSGEPGGETVTGGTGSSAIAQRAFGGKTLKQIQREAVEFALEQTGGNKSAAARMLEIPIATFKRMVKRYEEEDRRSS